MQKRSSGTDFIVLFQTGLSCLISKLSFISSLKLLKSDAKISKLSKIVGKSHCNSGSDIANPLVFLIPFPVRFKGPMCSHTLAKTRRRGYSVISNLKVTTSIEVDCTREDFSLEGIFESK